MADRLHFLKLTCGTLVAIGVLVLAVVGTQTIWRESIVKDYDKHLIGEVYVDVAIKKNVNLVFYRKGCPYCEKGKAAVIDAAKTSEHPTFYIDVTSESGQVLVKQYHVKKAATLVQLRNGHVKQWAYAMKDSDGNYQPNLKSIKEVFND